MRHTPARMDTRAFNAKAQRLLDHRGWKRSLSRATGKNYATVKRWSTGDLPVPAYVDMLLELLELLPKSEWPAQFLSYRAKAVREGRRPRGRAAASAA